MPTILTRRIKPSSPSFWRRLKPWANSMDILSTWFWDDTQNWNDTQIWFDTGSTWTVYSRRPTV